MQLIGTMDKTETWEEEVDTGKKDKAAVGLALLSRFLQAELRYARLSLLLSILPLYYGLCVFSCVS